VIEQGGLAGAEETSEHGDGHLNGLLTHHPTLG
jgi:hypothetical protein